MEGRSRSEPPVDNVFYSERVRQAVRVESLRPTNLPVPSDDESEKVPIQDRRGQPSSADGHTGKGQGNVAVQAEGQVVSGCFETPPSKPATGTPEPLDDRRGGRLGIGGLRQSSGMMPPDSGDRDSVPSKKALRTMGPMKSANPSSVEGKPSRVGVADAGDDGLQQALERELVEHLKEHNLRLQAELDELKAAQQGKTGSASSQSRETVDEPFNSKPAVHRSPRRSRSRTQEKQVVRLTPGGTRVPDGPPPLDDDEADLPRPPPMPNLPSFPVGGLAAAGQLAGYEMVEDVSMVKGGSRPWRPSNVDVVSPRTAKKFWVDREVQSFRNMLENRYAGNHYEGHEYWGRSSVEAASAGALVSSGKHGEVSHEDRAVAQHGEHRDQARALVQHADLCGHDRAPLQHGEPRGGGRASAHGGEVRAGDRADALPADPRAEDRAIAQLYEARGDGRAGALSGHREGSRASMHPEHRADGRALSSSPMLDSVQEINARDVERRQYYENLKDYYKHPLGHGVGDPSKPPEHPASPLWAPPVGGGRTIEFESESPPPGGMGQRYGAMPVWNEGGSGGNRTELPELAADATPLEFGDWVAMIGPSMRDLSAVSGRWWSSTVTMAQQYYSAWKEATPLQRVQIQPELPMMLTDVNFMRTEQRGVTLLLKAIPQDLRQSLITDRQLTSTAILYKLYVRYQPGGAGEKTLLLQQLTSTACTGTTGMSEVCDVLRKWRRHFGRAQEIQAVLPDGVLLLQALEPAVQAIMLKDSQAGFRLAQSRVQLGIDERPHHGALWSFSQCLLAEAETLALLHPGGTAAPGTPAKVKQVQVPNPSSPSPTKPTPDDTPGGGKPGKGNGASGDKPCRYFISENGCKAGKACKFLHSWEGVADKAARCWICGATSHRKAECPVRASGGKPSPSGGGSGSGGGGGSDGNGRGRGGDANKRNPYPGGGGGKSSSSGTGGGGSTTTKTSPGGNDNPGNETPAVNEMSTTGNASTGKEMSSTGMGGPTKVGANDLLLEATQLLKSLRMPSMNVMKLTKIQADEEWVLLDSGATHGLRPACSQEEWNRGIPTKVTLAEGETHSLKLKQGTRVLLADPSTTTSWIVPLGGVTELGYSFEWKGSSCTLSHRPRDVTIPVEVKDGCPMIPLREGQRILQQLEDAQQAHLQRLQTIRALAANPQALDPTKMTMDMAMLVKLRALFPMLPEEVLERTVPPFEAAMMTDLGSKVPWNRRKRRRLQRADNVIVHLYAGNCGQYWEKALGSHNTEVLCVDLLAPVSSDMMSPEVFWFVMSLMMTGRVKAILAGPPCRTVSALRFQDDQGPGVVRDEQHPWGRPENTEKDAELVLNDSALWVKALLAYSLAEDARLELRPDAPQICPCSGAARRSSPL
eukprot:Skav221621  [mRNA]  locus=scaffold2664:47322:51461:- [translate_table: standard]